MKFTCVCGYIISDNTTNHYCKAHLIADQDIDYLYSDLHNLIEEAFKLGQLNSNTDDTKNRLSRLQSQKVRLISGYRRIMYQCPNCGRLHINDKSNQTHIYHPDNDQQSFEILSSTRHSLTGHWKSKVKYDSPGWLSWDTQASRNFTVFDTWDELQTTYHQKFEEFQSKGLLRTASLTKDNETVHSYSAGEN